MATKRDSKGQRYREVRMSDQEQVRITYIEHSEWAHGPVLRIQKRNFKGKLVPGPEVPVDATVQLLGAMAELVNESKVEP